MGTESVPSDGDLTTTTSNIFATHVLANDGEDTWVFIGDYQHELERTDEGWKITFIRANLHAQLGNSDLPTLAKSVSHGSYSLDLSTKPEWFSELPRGF